MAFIKICEKCIRHLFLILFFATGGRAAYAQSEIIEKLTAEGIALHDKGDYAGAIEKYKKVLVYDPTSDLMNYEIAFSYAENKDYMKALLHCDIVINGKGQAQLLALILKGTLLDQYSTEKEAEDFYKKTLKSFPNQYLLLLNYGIRCNKLERLDEAEKYFRQAILLKPDYAGSHLNLAYLKLKRGERLKGLLGMYYFLLLEHKTDRAALAFNTLITNLDIADKNSSDPAKVNLNITFPTSHEKLTRTDLGELSLYLITTTSADLQSDQTVFRRLCYDTKKIFTSLGELQAQGDSNIEDYWWGFYVPFFYELKTEGHAEAYCYTIASAINHHEVIQWQKKNNDKILAFERWLKSR